MKTTLAERVQIALAGPPERSQVDLATACGVKPPSVNDWVTGETKSIKGANLVAAAAFLQVNPTWLATGKGPMRIGDHPPERSALSDQLTAARERLWPFPRVNRAKLTSLKGAAATAMENAMLATAGDFGVDIRNRKAA